MEGSPYKDALMSGLPPPSTQTHAHQQQAFTWGMPPLGQTQAQQEQASEWVNQLQLGEEQSEYIIQGMLAEGVPPEQINALRAKGMGKGGRRNASMARLPWAIMASNTPREVQAKYSRARNKNERSLGNDKCS